MAAIITNKSWKYDLKTLESTSDEFKLVENFFKITSIKTFPDDLNLKNFQICKVVERRKNETDEGISPEERANLMLFHGTSRNCAVGILEEGFRNSPGGTFGEGVYMTDSSYIASRFSVKTYYRPKTSYFIFVNEVLGSEFLQTFSFERYPYPPSDEYTYPKTLFAKHAHYLSAKITEESYKEDVEGRRYRNAAVDKSSLKDEFVADCEVTIPRYLIRFETEKRMYKPPFVITLIYGLVILGFMLMVFLPIYQHILN